jgi:hypothetical protein
MVKLSDTISFSCWKGANGEMALQQLIKSHAVNGFVRSAVIYHLFLIFSS